MAYSLGGQVTNAEKSRRSGLMIATTRESEEKFLNEQVGTIQEVLFETFEESLAEGYTPNYTRVAVKTSENLTGKIKKVKIISFENDLCFGELI